jgi:FkbM family methyltransferase
MATLIPVGYMKKIFQVEPQTILHVGAHFGEELVDYIEAGWGRKKRIWVEAQSNLAENLRKKISGDLDFVLEACVWSTSGEEKVFNNATNSQSSSLLEFAEHSVDYPEITKMSETRMITVRLDDLLSKDEKIDLVNLDIQGAELEAIKGLGKLADDVKWIYTEVNWKYMYADCPLIDDLDLELAKIGFVRVATKKAFRASWGDALYVKQVHLPRILKIRKLIYRLISPLSIIRIVIDQLIRRTKRVSLRILRERRIRP